MIHQRSVPDVNGMVGGLILMFVGAFLILGRAGIVDPRLMWQTWGQLIPIAVGVWWVIAGMFERRRRHRNWSLVLGLWLLCTGLGFLGFYLAWSLFLVAIGIVIMWDAYGKPSSN